MRQHEAKSNARLSIRNGIGRDGVFHTRYGRALDSKGTIGQGIKKKIEATMSGRYHTSLAENISVYS
jgi:hypothetical protein